MVRLKSPGTNYCAHTIRKRSHSLAIFLEFLGKLLHLNDFEIVNWKNQQKS